MLVAGQHKDARDLSIIREFGLRAPRSWRLSIAGRGWPALPGWSIDSRFLDESEFSARLSEADVLLLPYKFYFQSGVAVRAVESGCPVAAERHEFLEEILGLDWPGFVDGDSTDAWVEAAARAMGTETPAIEDIQRRFRRAWHLVIETL